MPDGIILGDIVVRQCSRVGLEEGLKVFQFSLLEDFEEFVHVWIRFFEGSNGWKGHDDSLFVEEGYWVTD